MYFFLQCFAWPLFFRPDLQATRLSLAPASSKPGSQRYASPVLCRAASRHHSGDSGENGFDGRLVHGKIPPHVRYLYRSKSAGFQEFVQLNSIEGWKFLEQNSPGCSYLLLHTVPVAWFPSHIKVAFWDPTFSRILCRAAKVHVDGVHVRLQVLCCLKL